MATISKLLQLLNGLPTSADLTTSDLVTNSVWVGGTTSSPSVQVTPSLLNSFLTSITAGSGISVTGSAPSQTVAVDNTVVRTNGANAFTADQSMGSNKLTSLAAGTTATDAVNYGQVLLASGANAATGALDMGTHQIHNVVDPTSAQDAATKNYVDTHAGNATDIQTAQTSGFALTANTSYVVRWAVNGETAGSIYQADAASASTNGKYLGFGITSSTGSVSIGGSVNVLSVGSYTLASGDTAFNSTDIGKAVYLKDDGSGGFTVTPPSTSGSANYRIGIVQTTTSMWLGTYQLNGVA